MRSFPSATNLLDAGPTHGAEVLVVDYRLPDANGFDVLREMHRRGWSGRAVLITALPTSDLLQEARACGYHEVLEKPLRQQALIAALGD